jgi:hypothetical protein
MITVDPDASVACAGPLRAADVNGRASGSHRLAATAGAAELAGMRVVALELGGWPPGRRLATRSAAIAGAAELAGMLEHRRPTGDMQRISWRQDISRTDSNTWATEIRRQRLRGDRVPLG